MVENNLPTGEEYYTNLKKQNKLPTAEEYYSNQKLNNTQVPSNPIAFGLGTLGNLPGSLVNNVSGMITGIPNVVNNLPYLLNPTTPQAQQMGDSLIKYFPNKYGTWDKIKESVYKDPVGILQDLSMILGGVGGVASKVGEMGEIGALGSTGRALGTVSEVSNPVNLAMKMTGSGLKQINKITAPFANTLDQDIINAAQRQNVPLTASMQSKSPIPTMFESLSAKGYAGSNKMMNLLNESNKALNDVANNLIKSTGKDTSNELTGSLVNSAIDKSTKIAKDTEQKLYNESVIPKTQIVWSDNNGKLIPSSDVPTNMSPQEQILWNNTHKPIITQQGVTVQPQNSLQWATDVLDRKLNAGSTAKSGDVNFWKNIVKDLENTNDASTLNNMKIELNRRISNSNDVIASGNNSEMQKLASLMKQDIDNSLKIQRPDIYDALQKANQTFSQNREMLNNQLIQNVKNLSDQGKYDLIVKQSITPNRGIDQIHNLYQIIGPEATKQVQATFLDNIFTETRNPATGNFTPQGLLNIIKKYTPEKLQAILTPAQYETLSDMSQIAKGTGKSANIMGGSQTMFGLRNLRLPGEIAGALINPKIGIPAITADILGQVLPTTKIGQKYLGQGFNLPKQIGQGLQNAAPQSGQYANIGNLVNRLYDLNNNK